MQTTTNHSDGYLVKLLEERNPEGVEILYDKYASAIFGAICREVNEEHVAEQILQASFFYIWDNPPLGSLYRNHLLLYMLNIAKCLTSKTLNDIAVHNDKLSKIIS